MKVLKVIVDELPDGCNQCPLLVMGAKIMCITNRKTIAHSIDSPEISMRPDWCPLHGDELYMVKGKAKPGSYRNARGAIAARK